MVDEELNLYMDMVQMMLRATDKLTEKRLLSDKERSSIKSSLGSIKNTLYHKESFKDIYIRYCKDGVRLIG